MKTKLHNLAIRICIDDYSGDFAGRQTVDEVFNLIEKVKGAVISKGGKMRSFTYDNTPNREDNIDGNTPSLRFQVVTPYPCTAELVVTVFKVNEISGPGSLISMIDFKVDLSEPLPAKQP